MSSGVDFFRGVGVSDVFGDDGVRGCGESECAADVEDEVGGYGVSFGDVVGAVGGGDCAECDADECVGAVDGFAVFRWDDVVEGRGSAFQCAVGDGGDLRGLRVRPHLDAETFGPVALVDVFKWAHNAYKAADELWVTPGVLEDRLRVLHPHERRLLALIGAARHG